MCYCPVLELTKKLIKCRSISPNDDGCQDIIISKLESLGFNIEHMSFGDTTNTWAWRGEGCTLVFSGHTDVVPIGNEQYWNTPPFDPILEDNILYGRGAADMKGALAAMIIAAENFFIKNPFYQGRLAFVITSDEESNAHNGTVKVVKKLMERKERLDYCLVGEPSSSIILGDTIKNGRRGSLTANIVIKGIQGHVAYPHLADNIIHQTVIILKHLIETKWDKGNIFFPPTTMQVVNIYADSGGNNITPSELLVQLNFRFGTEIDNIAIRQSVEKLIQYYGLRYSIKWTLSGYPFLTARGKLINAVVLAIKHYQGIIPNIETTGGTSDGRFFAVNQGTQVVEFGLINATIHKANECINISDLKLLSQIYQYIIELLIL